MASVTVAVERAMNKEISKALFDDQTAFRPDLLAVRKCNVNALENLVGIRIAEAGVRFRIDARGAILTYLLGVKTVTKPLVALSTNQSVFVCESKVIHTGVDPTR